MSESTREERFRRAVLAADLAAVRRLLEAGVDPDVLIDAKRSRRQTNRDLCADGFTALHVAAYEDDGELAAMLFEHGAEPWARTRFSVTPLGLAADWGSPAFVIAFLAAGLDPEDAPNRPLVRAAGQGHLDIVRLLLEAGARKGIDVAVQQSCSYKGDPALLAVLLDAGADPPAPADVTQWTARVSALYCRREECLRLLAARTTAATLVDAAIDGNLELVRRFLADGVDVDVTLVHGIRALVAAARRGHLDVVRSLLDAGAAINHRSVLGTALTCALRGEHLDVAELLFERGARLIDKKVGSSFGQLIASGVGEATFRWIAARHAPPHASGLLGRAAHSGDVGALEALLAIGVDPDGGDGFGRAPLALAAFARRTEVVRRLLAHGADPRAVDPNGRPLLHYILTYDDYTDDWYAEDFDPMSYDREAAILEHPAVKLLLAAGAPLPWST